MLMEMAGLRSCQGSSFHEDGPDEQNARGPSVEVVIRGVCVVCGVVCVVCSVVQCSAVVYLLRVKVSQCT